MIGHGSALRVRAAAAAAVALAGFACGPISASVARAAVPRFSWPVQVGVGVNPDRLVAADLNGDGRPDLATADYGSSTVSVVLGKGDGSFGRRTSYNTARHPAGLTVADVDGDGDRDLVSASINPARSITVLRNQGAGRFRRDRAYRAGAFAHAVVAADVNRDGTVDLLTAHGTDHDFAVLLGTGAGRFRVAHRYTGVTSSDVAVGDLNGDGNLDVVLDAGSVAVRLGHGDGTFGPAHAYKSGPLFGVTAVDLNHDDKLDIAVVDLDPPQRLGALGRWRRHPRRGVEVSDGRGGEGE